MEAFTTKGHWWLPGDPDKKIAGNLTFDPSGLTVLELYGSLVPWEEMVSVGIVEPIILGVSEKGKDYSLFDCQLQGTNMVLGGTGWISSKYLLNYFIQGHCFPSKEDAAFQQLNINYYGLLEWASTRKFWKPFDFSKPPLTRSTEDDVSVSLDEFNLTVKRGFTFEGNPRNTFSVNRFASLELVADIALGIEEIISLAFRFQVFLSLAMRTATWPISVEMPHPFDSGGSISFHYSPHSDFHESDRVFRELMYFTLEDLKEDIEPILKNWFARSDMLDQVFGLYNRAISKKMYLDDNFLILAKAVEAYHRQMHKETYIDKAEFEKLKTLLKKEIKPCIPSKDLRRRIYESMNLANNPSLRDRLADLQKKHQGHNRNLFEDFDTFADAVVSTRDQLTHYFGSGKSKARLDGQSLNYMSKRLRLVLELCLLSEMGFNDEELLQMAAKNIPPDPERSSRQSPQPAS